MHFSNRWKSATGAQETRISLRIYYLAKWADRRPPAPCLPLARPIQQFPIVAGREISFLPPHFQAL